MEQPRLKSHIRASAMLRQANLAGGIGMMLRKGDPDAGSILLVLRDRSGAMTVLFPSRTLDGEEAWSRGTGPEPVDQTVVDGYLARQLSRDPDLWILEIEGPDLRPPFEVHLI